MPMKPNPMLAGLLQRAEPASPTDEVAATAASANIAAATTPARQPGPARQKLWGLDKKFHCLLIGTCLNSAELARLAKRFDFAADARNEYGMHVEAVGCCASRNPVSSALQKQLDHKYRAAIAAFETLRSPAEVLAAWQECLRRGEVAGPLWATVSHKHADADGRQAAYAAVHMLSHQVGAGLAADVRRLDFLTHDHARLQRELSAERIALAQRAALSEDEHRALRREIATLREENTADRESVV